MAAFKFFKIGKANAEIDRLEAELTTAKAKLADVEQATGANSTEIAEQAEQLQTDLKAAQAQVATLTSEKAALASENAALKSTAATFAAKEAAMEKTIEEKASARALEIVAKTGTPLPLATLPNANPGATPKADKSNLSGKSLMAAAFNEQFATK